MLHCQRTSTDPRRQLAIDEAMLESSEQSEGAQQWFRLWELPQPAVILGRACDAMRETNWEACRKASVPVLRRASGGGAVVVGPGCLVYSLVVSYHNRPDLRELQTAHRYVLEQIAAAVSQCGLTVELAGTSDLIWNGRKVSGNSLKCKRHSLLYHGTVLYNAELAQIGALLDHPSREPDYRDGRPHQEFVANLPIEKEELTDALMRQWNVKQCGELTDELIESLWETRYSRDKWHRDGAMSKPQITPGPSDVAAPTPD